MSAFNPRLFACILLSTICAGGCTRDTNGGVTLPEGHIVERERFTAEVFFEAPGMNLVYDLRYGDFDGEAGNEVLVVSQDGYRLVSPEGRLKRTVAFQPAEAERWAVKYVGSAAGGELAFVAALPLKRQLALYGADGNSVWTAPAPGDYPLLNIADVSGDGVVEIISALRGIQVHDRGGNRVRTLTKRTCASVAIVALPNPDGPRIIADLRGDGANPEGIHVFSAEGRVLSQWTPDFFYRDFAAVERSGERLPELVFANGDSLVIKGLDGKTLRTLDPKFEDPSRGFEVLPKHGADSNKPGGSA